MSVLLFIGAGIITASAIGMMLRTKTPAEAKATAVNVTLDAFIITVMVIAGLRL